MINRQLEIKKVFRNSFEELLFRNRNASKLVELLLKDGDAYVVGGFVRDLLHEKESRDIDIIVSISSTQLLKLSGLVTSNITSNRHGGLKINVEGISFDVWSFDNNWAFKNELVKLNTDNRLHSIAKGCFYNYDALVVDLKTYSYNIKYYSEFCKLNKLDILQKNTNYKNLNPTIEANILRAFYIQLMHNSNFSSNVVFYLIKKLGALNDRLNGDAVDHILKIARNYKKYDNITEEVLRNAIHNLKQTNIPNSSLFIDF